MCTSASTSVCKCEYICLEMYVRRAHKIIAGLLKIFSLTLCRPENVFVAF